MGSPLGLNSYPAEIRVTDIEQRAIANSTRKPKHYYHFVDDGFGHFINRNHAEEFLEHLNSLAPDLDYTIEHPSPDGSIPFLNVLIHSFTQTPAPLSRGSPPRPISTPIIPQLPPCPRVCCPYPHSSRQQVVFPQHLSS